MMGRKCCVPGCNNANISGFYKFPSNDPEAFLIWKLRTNVECQDEEEINKLRICRNHFMNYCFRIDSRFLVERSLPTIGLPGFQGDPNKRENSFLPSDSKFLNILTDNVKLENDDWGKYSFIKTEVIEDDSGEVFYKEEHDTSEELHNVAEMIKTEASDDFPSSKIRIVHMCQVCMQIFPDEEYLDQHMENIHRNDNPFTCDICTKGFATKQLLVDHLLSRCGTLELNCRVSLTGYADQTKERDTSVLEQPLTCSVEFRDWNRKKYPCGRCDKVYLTSCALSHHKKYGCRGPKIQCFYCHRLYCSLTAIRQHIHHNHMKGKLKFICQTCRKSYSDKYKLKEHERYGCGGSKLSCDYCSRVYGSRNSLYDHMRKTHCKRNKNKL